MAFDADMDEIIRLCEEISNEVEKGSAKSIPRFVGAIMAKAVKVKQS